ncbi:MAG: hypothetical protein ACI97K_001604 [Glaciecola sp.]|jgi:hypothetical protein
MSSSYNECSSSKVLPTVTTLIAVSKQAEVMQTYTFNKNHLQFMQQSSYAETYDLSNEKKEWSFC